jgi:opacity protein-like surface antigen
LKTTPLILCLVATATAASAQESEWRYKATLYGWLPGLSGSLETEFGTIDLEPDGSGNALSDLDMAFMGSFSAQNGRLSILGDLLYADLSSSKDTPFALFGDSTVDVEVAAVSGYVLYRVTNDTEVMLDVGGGFRNFDVSLGLSLSPGLSTEGASRTVDDNWTDPLLAARLTVPLDDRWFLIGFADFGGTGSGNQTWQVYAGAGYTFNERWSGQLGYRHMEVSRVIDNNDMALGLGGPVFAISYSF